MKSKRHPVPKPSAPSVTFIKSPVKLTISLLVSNRIGTIRKCMESLRPLLEQLSSELIVVDTVGEENSDGSLAVAREYTDKIVRFEWCNDFAAARNAGLSRARGEWFLYLDDDEWFDDVTPIIEFLKNDDGKYNYCQYYARNYQDYSGHIYQDTQVGRMVRRSNLTIFKDKIHEYIYGAFDPTKLLNCFVHHYGYVFSSQEEKLARSRRNVVPLEEMLAENPKNLRTIMQLCLEYTNIQDYEKARELCTKAMEFGLESKTAYMGWIADCYIKVLYHLNETEALLEQAEALVLHPNVTELAKAGICQFVQNVSSAALPAEKALFYIDAYFSCVDALDQNPDLFSSQVVLALEVCQNAQNRENMLLRALTFCKQTGDQDKSWAYLQRCCDYGDRSEAFLISKMRRLLEASLDAGKFAQLCERLSPALQKKSLLLHFLQTIDALFAEEKDLSRNKKLDGLRGVSTLPYKHPHITLHKLKLAEAEGRTQELSELVEAYAADDIEAFQSDELLLLCYRNSVSPEPLIGKLFIETWESTAERILTQTPLHEHELILGFLRQFWSPASPEMLYLNMASQFRALSLSIAEEPDAADFNTAFARYIEANEAYYRRLYHPDNFSPQACVYLERNARAAYFLAQSLEYGRSDQPELQLRFLRKALACREDLKSIVQYAAKCIEAKQAAAPTSPETEMQLLSRTIKNNIRALLDAQAWAQADSLLKQLKAITPDDPELNQLFAKLPG